MAVSGTMDVSRRRFVFGLNALLQVVLAAALIVGVIWLAARLHWQVDTTKTGVNSLSSATVTLLKNLDQNIRITAVFPEPDKRDEVGQKHRREIRDLLDLYEAAGHGHVSTYVLDPSLQKAETDALLKRLKDLPAYRDEAKPHEEALAKFGPLNEKITKLITGDEKQAEDLVAGNQRLARDRNFAIVRNNLMILARQAQAINEDVQDASKGDIPHYGQAVKKVRDYLASTEMTLRDALSWMKTDALSMPDITPELKTFFTEAPTRYDPVLKEITDLQAAAKDLKDVKLEEVYNGLTRWRSGPPVLVEGEKEARVLSNWEVWPMPSDRNAPTNPDGDDREFAGESVISSAILQLTQKEKTAVIFVRFGGEPLLRPDFSKVNLQQMRELPRAPMGQLNERLKKAGFVTEDWDVSQAKTPPEVKDAVRRAYIVLPPEPPPRQNPMEPSPQGGMTPADRKIVLDAIDASGEALFLSGWQPPTSPMPGATEPYEYADYLKKDWGIDGEYSYLTLGFTAHPDKPGYWVPAGREPWLITTDRVVHLTDNPISKPSQNDRAGFYQVAPLKILSGDQMPAGVTVQTIAEIPRSEDVWACDDLRRLDEQAKRDRAFRPGETDLKPPYPIAVSATNKAGHKIVVFSSVPFAMDQMAQATGLQQVGNSLVLGALYPANTDLIINSLHWLTGEADRIAVGPRRGDVPRLSKLNDAWADRLPWFLVGIWPAVALLVGVGVWMVRRR